LTTELTWYQYPKKALADLCFYGATLGGLTHASYVTEADPGFLSQSMQGGCAVTRQISFCGYLLATLPDLSDSYLQILQAAGYTHHRIVKYCVEIHQFLTSSKTFAGATFLTTDGKVNSAIFGRIKRVLAVDFADVMVQDPQLFLDTIFLYINDLVNTHHQERTMNPNMSDPVDFRLAGR